MGSINKSSADYWLSEDGLLLLECWSRDGMLLKDIATNMGISPAQLSHYRKQYEEIDKALATGKEIVDYRVENALLKSALGFKTQEITVTIGHRQINGQWVDITKETKTKEVAPNVTAALAWLNNRKPDVWKRNRDNVVEMDDEDNDVKITIVRGRGNSLDETVNNETTLDQKDIKKAKKELEKDPWDGWENW
jgi:hypothetical protein